MINKPIHRAASTQEEGNSNSNASPFIIFPTGLSAPLQATLFEMAPDSDFANLIDFASQVANFQPSLLDSISDDLIVAGLAKKQQRADHKRWLSDQTEALLEVPQEEPAQQKLETGRPRIKPIIVLTFMLLRGSLGCCCKDTRYQNVVKESISLRIFLENQGCVLPGASTLEENLSAISNNTREKIFRAELALVLEEELDDFEKNRSDSTAVNSASAYPADSETIAKLLCRMCIRLEKLERIGLASCPFIGELEKWQAKLKQLKFRIGTLSSSSAKQAELGANKEAKENTQMVDNQPNAENKESPKQRTRRKLYEELYALGEEILPKLEKQLTLLSKQIQGEKSSPKEQGRRERFIEEFREDLDAAKRGIEYSRQRICEGKKPNAKKGKMPWSVSDMSASFIEKGGWEKTFGYRVQLSFSASNLVTALIVPEGNAADQDQYIGLVKAAIENTGVVPKMVSTDDGYTGAKQLRECLELGVEIVSFSGARGKALLGEEKWESEAYKEARLARNGAESGIGVLKAMEEFGQLATCGGIERVRGELLEKVISYNALKIVSLRKSKYEEEHKKKWAAGLPSGKQEIA